jgi:hypothetical protein
MYNFVIITKCHLSKVQLVLSLTRPGCSSLCFTCSKYHSCKGGLVCTRPGSSPFSACLAHARRLIKGLPVNYQGTSLGAQMTQSSSKDLLLLITHHGGKPEKIFSTSQTLMIFCLECENWKMLAKLKIFML